MSRRDISPSSIRTTSFWRCGWSLAGWASSHSSCCSAHCCGAAGLPSRGRMDSQGRSCGARRRHSSRSPSTACSTRLTSTTTSLLSSGCWPPSRSRPSPSSSRERPENQPCSVDEFTVLRLRLSAVPLAALVLSIAPLTFSPATAGAARPAAVAASSGSWTEYHHDDAHTGYDSTAPAALGASAGWTSPSLNGEIYGEPLVYNGLVYVATLQNVVYALHQSDGTVAWSKALPAPQTTGWQCGNINPTGILGTGIIDPVANRIYYVPFLKDFGTAYYLYALDLTTGNILMTTEIAPTGFEWTI